MAESIISRRGGSLGGTKIEIPSSADYVSIAFGLNIKKLDSSIEALSSMDYETMVVKSDSSYIYVLAESYYHVLIIKLSAVDFSYIGYYAFGSAGWGSRNEVMIDNSLNFIYFTCKNSGVSVLNKTTLALVTTLPYAMNTSSCLTQDATSVYLGTGSALIKIVKTTWTATSTTTNGFRWLLFAHGKLYGAYVNDTANIRTYNTSTFGVTEVIASSIAQYNYVAETDLGIVMTALSIRHFNATTKVTTAADYNITYNGLSYSNVWSSSLQYVSYSDGKIYTANQNYFAIYSTSDIAQPLFLTPIVLNNYVPLVDANHKFLLRTKSPYNNLYFEIFSLSENNGYAIKK